MRLIDTHSHIYEPEFDSDRELCIERALNSGVELMLFPAIDSESHDRMFLTACQHPEAIRTMMGLHPTSVNDNPRWREELQIVERLLDNPPEGIGEFCAVGEIGLDFYWSNDFREEQIEAFILQLRMAAKRNLPVAIHTRAAWDEMEQILKQEVDSAEQRGESLRGVLHAFSEDAERYRRMRSIGDFKFGVGGVVTFKKSTLAESVKEMALEDIVLETDSPYLTPAPFRGKRNESGYISYICSKVAELKGVSEEEVAEITTRNATHLFNLNSI